MTDLELTKLCAEAMGYAIVEDFHGFVPPVNGIQVEIDKPGVERSIRYNPISDDAQAMALLKEFELFCEPPYHEDRNPVWDVSPSFSKEPTCRNTNLNRAICECCARMQKAKNDSKA